MRRKQSGTHKPKSTPMDFARVAVSPKRYAREVLPVKKLGTLMRGVADAVEYDVKSDVRRATPKPAARTPKRRRGK